MYLVIKELSGSAQDVIMVISSLTQDINSLPQFRASAIRVLGTVVDSSMISGVERVLKQAIGDRNPDVVASALTTAIHFFAENREAVRRWLPEIQSAFQAGNSKTTAQYHVLGLLYLVKQHDRMALCKLVQSTQSGASHMLATTLTLQIYSQLLENDSGFIVDLKPFLRMKGKSDMVALEAARVICSYPEIYGGDIVFAITSLQMFLSSNKALLRFAALRVLNEFAAKNTQAQNHVSVCNSEIEGLVSDPNRNVATLAITTLLKTGSENSVDRLIAQISGYVAEISDEFKVTVVEAVRSLGVKFPNKAETMLTFLGTILREDGGLLYKSATVNAICDLLSQVPSARDIALVHLSEFIEDCEYPELTAQILHLLGEEGTHSANPARIVRYIYNRLILEGALVRGAAVGALARLAASCPSLQNGIVSILHRALDDMDDDVRDRAAISLKMLEEPICSSEYLTCDQSYDLDELEVKLYDYIRQSEAALSVIPLDLSSVPIISKAAIFEKASIQKTLSPVHDALVPEINNATLPKTKSFMRSIDSIPQLSEFGTVFVSSAKAEALTEAESEYIVRCRKHIYRTHLVIEFECHNTVRELVLTDVTVNISVDSQYSFAPIFALPITRLPFDEIDSCFVAFIVDNSLYPEATFECSLRLTATEVDPDTGNAMGRGTSDEYSINTVALGISDYIQARQVANFSSDWVSLDNELIETLELPSMQTIKEARMALLNIIGLEPYHESDNFDSYSNADNLLLVGYLFNGDANCAFGIRARFVIVKNSVIAEIAVRSSESAISSQILNAFC